MNLVFRIVFGIVLMLIFVSITFSTFFVSKQYTSLPVLDIQSSQNIGASGSLYYTSLSKYESLYTSQDISENINLDSSNISVHSEGKYFSSYRKIGTVHDFTGTGFIISQKGIGEMYIDTISKKGKVFIYAKNTPAEVVLTSDDGEEEYTTIYLAPGMYLEFRTGIGKNLNNADRLRISMVNALGYISSFSDTNIRSSLQVYFSGESSIMRDALQHIQELDEKKTRYLSSMPSGNIPTVSGYGYIQRYLHLFINTEKKKVFYKNIVLEGYIKLLATKKIDQGLIKQIKKDENTLQNIDVESYNELLLLRKEITSALNSMQHPKYIPSKIGFEKLDTPSIDENKWMYPLYSFSLFSSNIGTDISSQQLMKNFFDSFRLYMQDHTNKQDPYDYFLYFLEKRLLFLLAGNIDEQSMGAMFELLSSYVQLSLEAQYIEKNQKITQIYSITQILESLDIFLRSTYFLSQRQENNLLVLRDNTRLTGAKLSQLQGYIQSLYNIYEKNNTLLNTSSNRDAKIIENIAITKNNIDEYIVAIGNYEQYKDMYDISKSTILNVEVVGDESFIISEESGRKFLEQFKGFSQDSFSLSVIDNQFYRVNNIIIGGRKFDFEIYPYEGSKLKNIVIDGELQTTQYTLDNIQLDWKEKWEIAAQEEKIQFDFSRFFILTFLTQDQREVVNFNIEYKQEESKAEIVFKRDILLGDKGEFSSLKGFLDIDYSDISLIQEDSSYSIYLNNVDYSFNSTTPAGNIKKLVGIFQSEYILNDIDHTFKDVKVTLESERKGPNNSTIYEFGGVNIALLGEIYIDLLDDYLGDMLKNIDIYMEIYKYISSGISYNNLVIEYTPSSNKTRFKFDSGKKSFTIILQASEITGIYEGTTKLSSSPINIQDINSYIK